MNPNNCATCEHKENPQGGFCYMFKDEPISVCRYMVGSEIIQKRDLFVEIYRLCHSRSFDAIERSRSMNYWIEYAEKLGKIVDIIDGRKDDVGGRC